MSNWKLSIGAAFDRSPEPIFLLDNNLIAYLNPAAAAIFPTLAAGAPAPQEFTLLEPDCAALLTLIDRSWSALLWEADGKRLVRLESLEEHSILPDHRISYLVQQLRGPLTSLGYTNDSLESQFSDEQLRQFSRPLARSRKAQHRLLRLMHSLELAALPDDAEPYDFHPQLVDLTGLLRETLRELETPLAMAGCTIELRDNTRNLCSFCDDQLVQTLIYHLAGNAVRSAGQGGHLVLTLDRRKDLALISLEDNGGGLTPDQLATLFRPSEGGTTLSDPAHGLGLGITVCRKIARLHGGSLLLTNREKQGVRAVFSLKLASSGEPMCLHSPRLIDSSGGISPVLRDLSDVLPEQCYLPEI